MTEQGPTDDPIVIEAQRVMDGAHMPYVGHCRSATVTIPTGADVAAIVLPAFRHLWFRNVVDDIVTLTWNLRKGPNPDEYDVVVWGQGNPKPGKEKGECEEGEDV